MHLLTNPKNKDTGLVIIGLEETNGVYYAYTEDELVRIKRVKIILGIRHVDLPINNNYFPSGEIVADWFFDEGDANKVKLTYDLETLW